MNEENLNNKKANFLITVIAVITAGLRAFYIYYTPTWLRQHDVIGFGSAEGQAAFIEYFYDGNLLIDFDPRERWGFFHPPLHHMLAALWMRIQVLSGIAYEAACENVQILTLIYSLVSLYFAFLIFKYFKLEGRALVLAFSIVAIHPGFTQMAGSINNDMLAIMFTVMAIFYGLKWQDEPSWKYTILLALTIGLGMMTKLSAGLIAPAIAVLFIAKWIRGGRTAFAGYLIKYIVFILICAPLALWSPLRNLIKFGVPISFTPEVGEPVNASLLQRIFDMRTVSPFVYMEKYGDPYNEFNMLLGMMKSSLFGDQNFALVMAEAGHSGVGTAMITAGGWVLLLSGTVLAAICFYSTVRVLASKAYITDAITRLYFAAIYLVSVLMYINFMISGKYYSSMDFRYVLYLIPIEALMLGLYYEKGTRAFRVFSIAMTAIFAASSIAVYLMLYFAG